MSLGINSKNRVLMLTYEPKSWKKFREYFEVAAIRRLFDKEKRWLDGMSVSSQILQESAERILAQLLAFILKSEGRHCQPSFTHECVQALLRIKACASGICLQRQFINPFWGDNL